ncbi:MAG: aminotransferase class V-fold PLP-dependent enzyme [Planctomycetes bacterium]|nr:aminotransferase class V-fold PLP-dependent enzyme [Planctomycetota bacterium]
MPDHATYLDNASTSWPKPPGVARAMLDLLEQGSATPGRGAYTMAVRNGRTILALRHRLARLIGAPGPDHIILTSGATEALNIAIFGLFGEPPDAAPPRVITTVLEHNSVRRPLAALRDRGHIELIVIPADAEGLIDETALLDAVDERTALVACLSAGNVAGTVQPIDRICRGVRERNPAALTLVDASQSVGLIALNVDEDRIDLLACSGHKTLLGPTGTGVLYASPRALGQTDDPAVRTLRPTRLGGAGDDSRSEDMPEHAPGRFEPGTPNTIGLAGLLAALDARDDAPLTEAVEREHRLIARLMDRLARMPAVRVLGPTDVQRRVGIVSFTAAGWDSAELAAALDASFGICVRAGLHCAPGAHEALGTLSTGGAVRVSPGPYSTDADIDLLLDALGELLGG